VEADVYVRCYTLLVVHVTKEEEESLRTCHKRRRTFEDKQFTGWMSFVDVVPVYRTDAPNQQCQSTEGHNVADTKHRNMDTLHVHKQQH